MEREKLEGLLIDYIDGTLSEQETREVTELLRSDAEAKILHAQLKQVTDAIDRSAEMEPGMRMRSRFQQMLNEEEKSVAQPKGRQVFFHPMVSRVAAAVVLVMAGVAIGYWTNKQQENELAILRQEMETTKRMMMTMIDNQQSASQRIQGMNVALGIQKADDDVVRALVNAMNEDKNSNVRLAALEALSNFHQEPAVRKALVQSLTIQKDPVVQIALIQLMVRMKEKGVVNDLNRIINDENTIKAVKDEAYTGLLKLS